MNIISNFSRVPSEKEKFRLLVSSSSNVFYVRTYIWMGTGSDTTLSCSSLLYCTKNTTVIYVYRSNNT